MEKDNISKCTDRHKRLLSSSVLYCLALVVYVSIIFLKITIHRTQSALPLCSVIIFFLIKEAVYPVLLLFVFYQACTKFFLLQHSKRKHEAKEKS